MKLSVYEKIRCIENAFDNISNSIIFSTGKNEKLGADEVTPVLHYIIIKAQPQRFISQLNFINCFKGLSNGGKNAFLVRQFKTLLILL